jgi:dynactin complex subunit
VGGYIDLTPQQLRRIAPTVSKKDREFLLYAADSLENHDEVLDGLQSAEREKVQKQMASLRSANVVLRQDNSRLANRIDELLEEVVSLRADAIRYRWLRRYRGWPLESPGWTALDAAIDAARAKTE